MEGPYKRIKSGDKLYDPHDIARLPVDVRVHILTRVDRLEDLFTLARQMPLMKAFMKEKDVFGKWFRYHTGFSESESDQVDAYVTRLIKQLNGDDYITVGVGWDMRDNYINLSVEKDNSLLFQTNLSRLRNMFDKLELKTSARKNRNGQFNVIRQCDTEPILQLVKVARWVDKHFPDWEYSRIGPREVSFSHTLPFDLLALCQLPNVLAELDEDNAQKLGVVLKALYLVVDPAEIYTRLVQGLTTREWTVKQVFRTKE